MRNLFRSIAALGLASMLALAAAGPAAALTFKGTGFYARFGPSMATDVRGLVIGDRTGGDSPRLNVGLVGLLPHIEFTIVGRSIGCNGTPSSSNRAFRLEATADAHGDWVATGILAEWSRTDVRSVWINWGDGAVCQFSLNFEEIKTNLTPDYNGDAGLALTKEGTGTLVFLIERRPNDRARLSIVVFGQGGNDEVRIRLVNRPCGTTPTNTLVSYKLTDILISSFKSTTVPLTQNQLDAIRSMRVRITTDTETKWQCGPVSLMALLEP